MIEKNPWLPNFWNITNQARFVQAHGVEKAREAALEAGLNPDDAAQAPGLQEETIIPQGGDSSLIAVFNKNNATKFEEKAKAYKPQVPPPGGLNYAGYMQRKRKQRP